MLPFITKKYAEIFENLYNITNGDIILGGSLSLRLQGVINRDINDIDLNITKSDWDKYENKITKKYKVYYGALMNLYPNMQYKICTCLDSKNQNEFHLFINNIETNLYNIIVHNDMSIKVLKPELHLLDKECMLADDITNIKNISDVESIKKYLNEK